MTSSTFRTDAVFAKILRWWRCGPWSTSPLMRWPDRLASAVRLIAALVMLVSVPVAGALGTTAYTDDAALIRAEHAQARSVEALVLERPVYTPAHLRQAPVRWESASGPVEETVPVSRTVAQGERITVWLDESGKAVGAPRSPAAAVMNGIGVAAVVLVGAALSTWCLVVLTDRIVAYRRGVEWDRELLAMRRPTQGER